MGIWSYSRIIGAEKEARILASVEVSYHYQIFITTVKRIG